MDEKSESELANQMKKTQIALQKVVQNTESVSKDADRKFKVWCLQNTLFQNQIRLVTPSRLWCYEGRMDVLYHRPKLFGKISNDFLFLLFTDLLMYVSDRKSPAKIKETMLPSEIKIIDNVEQVQWIYDSIQTTDSAQIIAPFLDYEPSLLLENPTPNEVAPYPASSPSHAYSVRNLNVDEDKSSTRRKPKLVSPRSFMEGDSVTPTPSLGRTNFDRPESSYPISKSPISSPPKLSSTIGVDWGKSFVICSVDKVVLCIASNLSERSRWIEEIRNASSSISKGPNEISEDNVTGGVSQEALVLPSLMHAELEFDEDIG